jgi:uncharacterized protein YndB with AHSA1/START domain
MTTATAVKAKMTVSGDREIHVERIFNAPRERVFKAMTDPTLVAQWWGRGNKLTVEKFEPKPGGHWRFVEHSEGGEHGFEGRFAEVTPPERIVQTFEWDGMPGHASFETMTLTDLGDGRTRLNVVSVFMFAQDRDGMLKSGMEGGMNESYQALDRVLASMN